MLTELEITLRRGSSAGYEAELRRSHVADQGDVFTRGPLAPDFDPEQLPRIGRGSEYGVAIGRALLHDAQVRRAFRDATVAAGSESLRVRLYIHPDAGALHRIAWETARDDQAADGDGQLLFAGERCVFSRYITSGDARPLYRRTPDHSWKVLVAIVNPNNIGGYTVAGARLQSIDESLEVERFTNALAGHAETEILQSAMAPVTLNTLVEKLAEDFDVLVLVCHGALLPGPVLYLQKSDGSAVATDGEEFVQRIAELGNRPRLIFLASCQSASSSADTLSPGSAEAPHSTSYGASGAFAPLGPRLADAGIPAVIAMQGNIAIDTINDFIPAFFRLLVQDGAVDRAVSLARSQLRKMHVDWWAPSLIMRLKTGELFRKTGFHIAGEEFEYWKALTAAIANRKCTPLLGPALLEQHVGQRGELAKRLARKYDMPAPRGERDLLALVAQQLSTARGVEVVRRDMLLLLMELVRDRYRGLVPSALAVPLGATATPEQILERLRDTLAFASDRIGSSEAHAILARLPFSLYVTANPDALMERALERERPLATAVSEILRWNPELDGVPSVYATDEGYTPSLTTPLVYHFFGSARYQESIVVSQDHYLDALIAASRKDSVPKEVRSALSSRTLLFLGFHPDDWSFRAIFRFIMRQEGAGLLRKKKHVAVQIDPEESEFDDPEVARQYLSRYLHDEEINIYWGSVSDFLAELERQFNQLDGAVG